MRHLLLRERERLLADELGDAVLDGEVRDLVLREVGRPLGEERGQLVAQRVHAVAGERAQRMERVEVAERGRLGDLGRDALGLHVVDLVQRDDDGTPGRRRRGSR